MTTAVNSRNIGAHRTRHILYTLLFTTLICGGMLVARMIFTGGTRFAGLFGNLLLAWIPLLLALLLRRQSADKRGFFFWGLLVVWVLFFPNAYYIITDLIHMKKFGEGGVFPWFDLLMTASFACGGLFLGSLSLYLVHLLVRECWGWRAGWGFAVTMLALGSFGIYLGRKLRLNSWDVLTRPLKLIGDIGGLAEPQSAREVAAFSVTFFFFSLLFYAFMVSLARLHEIEEGS